MNSSFTEDESIDSAAEDYDTEELNVQDIAAIVLGDVKQVCINEVTSDNENDSFEQRYNSRKANKPLDIDPYSVKVDSVDASETKQELVNGNDEIGKASSEENLNNVGDIDPSSNSIKVETSFNHADQCSSPNTSPSRLYSPEIYDPFRSSSVSPIQREKTPDPSELNESSNVSTDNNSTGPDCLLKVLDEVKDSPRSCESSSAQRNRAGTPPRVCESNEQTKPIDSDNYNSFCDKSYVDKLSKCDRSDDGERTPRDGSQTPILFSPSHQDFATDEKDVTFETVAEVDESKASENREETNDNGAFESASELWKEDENATNSFTTIDIPLPPSENRKIDWKNNKWSSSKRDRDPSEHRRDRDRRDGGDSSRDGRYSKRSHHRDSSDEDRSKDSRSRKSDSGRSSRKRHDSRRRSREDYRHADRHKSESSRWSRRDRSRDRSSPHDRHRRSSRDDRRTSDRYSRDKSRHRDRHSSRDKSDKYRSGKHDRSRSKRDYEKSRRRSHSSDASSDDSRAHKTINSDRRSNDYDRRSNEYDRRTKDRDRRSKGHSRRSKVYDRKSHDRRNNDSDHRKSRDFDRRHNDSDRKSQDFERQFNEPDLKSYESEKSWNDDRFELNKSVEMPNPFEEENWDEEAESESYYCDTRPPEPKSPPPPEPDYPPPEPNYPPEPDYPPEPSYSPEDRPPSPPEEPLTTTTPPRFDPILENEYRTERSVSKDAERMICDCTLTKEEIHRGEKGCGEDCLNRLLLIECCSACCLGERCSNKRFQRREYPNCEIFKTKKKGHGLRTLEDIPYGTFIMEYVGEVLDSFEFEQRAMNYARGKKPHFYFMSLKSDHIIDATVKGNISRFINHSCEPNAETQKWTVKGELRIGFFSLRDIKAGEEITFDYQLQRYGKQAQRCYCDAPSCNGWIGDDPDKYVNDKRGFKDWETALDEISQVGLMNRHQTLNLNRLMVHAKELPVRMQILQLIEGGNPPCRRLFVDYHGLPIIWSWMADCTPEQDELKIQILKTLASLPITNKTILVDSKILSVVEQWAFMFEQKVHSSEALSAQSVLESVEDIASADETPVSELAQKLMNDWSSLREAYRIPRKERIQQMKKHELEADETMPKHRPKRLPVYAEQMRDRYRRNRHSRDKDFEKIYFDRMKDYGGATPDQKKRRESPGRNFENRKHRRGDQNKESGNSNKQSKSERRQMFELKVKREEEEQQNWLKLYYSQHQPQLAGMMLPAPYMTHIPPPNYPPPTPIDPKQQQPQQQPTSTRTHPYYPIAPPLAYPAVPTTHIQLPSSVPTTSSALPPATQYYRVAMAAAPYPTATAMAYARPTVADQVQQQQQPQMQPMGAQVKPEEHYMYDYHAAITNHLQQMPPIDEAALRDTLRMVDRRESHCYAPSSGGQPARDTDSADRVQLPKHWRTAHDNDGRVYYYHSKTRVAQWNVPTEASRSDEDTSDERSTGEDDQDVEFKKRRRKSSRGSEKEENDGDAEVKEKMDAEIKENLAAMSSEFQDSDYEDYSPALKNNEEEFDKQKLPNQDANAARSEKPRESIKNKKRIRGSKEKLHRHKKIKLTNGSGSSSKGGSNGHVSSNSSKLVSAPADTSSITERKKKDAFRTSMADFVVSCLNPYFRINCAQARITNDKDFKHLARKLTHFVMLKELKHCQSVTDLTCNTSVKYKAKEYIRMYMSKFGEIYIRPPDDANY